MRKRIKKLLSVFLVMFLVASFASIGTDRAGATDTIDGEDWGLEEGGKSISIPAETVEENLVVEGSEEAGNIEVIENEEAGSEEVGSEEDGNDSNIEVEGIENGEATEERNASGYFEEPEAFIKELIKIEDEVTLDCIEVEPVISGFTLDKTSLSQVGGTVVASVTGSDFTAFSGIWSVSLDDGATKIGTISDSTETGVTITFNVPANTGEYPRNYIVTLWLDNKKAGLSTAITVEGTGELGEPLTIITVAGNGTMGFSGESGLAICAQLGYPYGVAVDSGGDLYIADEMNYCVWMVSASNQTRYGIEMIAGNIYIVAGNKEMGYFDVDCPSTPTNPFCPHDIAVNNGGDIYIADASNNLIRMVSASNQTRYGIEMTAGNIYTIAGNEKRGYSGDGSLAIQARLHNPCGIALDSGFNLYIADTNNHCIRKVDTAGMITTVAGNIGGEGYDGDGCLATEENVNLQNPYAVAVDDNGSLYIADTENNRIRMVAGINQTRYGIEMTAGNIYTIAGNGKNGYSGDGAAAINAELYYPADVALDNDGNLYIAENYNNCIRKVDNAGIITTLSGQGPDSYGYSGDGGLAADAKLKNPYGVTADGVGNLFIADSGNYVVRKIYDVQSGSQPQLPTITGVTITGIAKFGHTLIANVTYSTPPEQTPTLSYQWKRNGQNISGAAGSSYTLQQADIGTAISVKVTASSAATGSLSSSATSAVQKADGPVAPAAPTLDSKTYNSVTLTTNSTYQFSKDGGSTWQDNNSFTGLSSSTEYTFIARVKETVTQKASAGSSGLNVMTKAAPRSGGGSGINRLKLKIGSLPDGIAEVDYIHLFQASGGRSPYSFRVTEGTLPEGMNLAKDGVLKGTPATAGTYKFTITVSDVSHSTSRHTFIWVVKERNAANVPSQLEQEIILTVGSLSVFVNGQLFTLEVEPFIDSETSRTMVPIRFISEALLAEVDWNSVTQQVIIIDGDQEIVLTIGFNQVLVNGIEQRTDCAPVIISPKRTFLPLRFVSETLGATVEYNSVNKQIIIRR